MDLGLFKGMALCSQGYFFRLSGVNETDGDRLFYKAVSRPWYKPRGYDTDPKTPLIPLQLLTFNNTTENDND